MGELGMPSTHSSLHFHVVFSTKGREPWLVPSVRQKLWAYVGGVVRGLDGVAHAVGGTGDHLHLVMGLMPVHRLSDVMREVKSESSKWVKGELGMMGFGWQEGYGAFSVGAPELERAKAYVLDQEERHRERSFQEEYMAMLKRGMVDYDRKFLW